MELIRRLHRWLGGEAAVVAETLRDRLVAGNALPLTVRQRGAWDRLIDALNRLPRPLTALGTLALIGAALCAPDWFAARMEVLAAMPEPLWWLAGAVISLFFGARFQAQEQAFARDLIAAVPPPDPLAEAAPGPDATLTLRAEAPGENAALAAWAASAAGQGTQA